MESSLYSTSTFKKVTARYADTTVNLKSRPFYTEQDMNMSFPSMLSATNDVKINNFSNLYLTDRKKLSDILSVKPLAKVQRIFTSFLAFNSVGGTDGDSVYWEFEETPIGERGRTCKATTISKLPINENFFEVVFLNEILCEIHHNDNNTDYLLSLDYSFNLRFAPRFDLLYLDGRPIHPQVFYYVYDEDNDYIVFYKKVLDFPYYLTFNPAENILGLKQPPLGSEDTFPVDSILKLRSRVDPTDSYVLNEFSAKYDRSTQSNTLDVSDTTSRRDIKNNYIINTEYSNVTSEDVTVNILTLKNELSPQNNNADTDPYVLTDDFTYRDYKKLFTGTQQVHGSESIILAYTGFTSKIEFKPNAITYFHVPTNTFPFDRLNINDSNIASKGAAASDHPLKADKIFKKRANYADFSYTGNSTDENNGEFLCAWLSGSSQSSDVVGVDRYYNPQKISYFSALAVSNEINDTYTTEFDILCSTAPTSRIIFDTKSNLYIEKGAYYAYHHIGGQDLSNYVDLLSSDLIQKDLVNYYTNNTQLLSEVSELRQYAFDGQQYSQTVPLTSIYANDNCFTIAFDIDVGDWRSDFAYQFIGNYTNTGFGIFNQTNITPYLMLPQDNIINILNGQGKVLDEVKFEANVLSILRLKEFEGYYVVLANNKIYKLTANHNIISEAQTDIIPFEYVTSSFYNSNSACFVVNSISANKVIGFDFTSETIFEPSSSAIIRLNSMPLSAVRSSVIYDNKFYCTSSYSVKLVDDVIYYIQDDSEMRKWNLSLNIDYPFLSATNPIDAFNIDKDGFFYILQDARLSKYTSTRQPVLTALTYDPDFRNVDIDFAGEFTPQGYQYNTIITQQAAVADAAGTRIYKISSSGLIISTLDLPDFDAPVGALNIANGDYLRREVVPHLTDNSLTVRVTLPSLIYRDDSTLSLVQSLSNVDSGMHNISVRFDNIQGELALFIDGIKMQDITFEPGKYARSPGLTTPFIIGSTPYFNNAILSQYLRGLYFYATATKLSDLRIYSKPLNDSDIAAIANSRHDGETMLVNLPAGKRNLNDEIERFFKLDVPAIKSSTLDISLVNTNIESDELKTLLATRILDRLQSTLPANVAVNNINWIN